VRALNDGAAELGTWTSRPASMPGAATDADVSLDQWLALTPPELVSAHLQADPTLIQSLRKDKVPIVPA
jgi:oxalate decarboxylase/phosphoglucose isomerase-like protein (cupin superfamily)